MQPTELGKPFPLLLRNECAVREGREESAAMRTTRRIKGSWSGGLEADDGIGAVRCAGQKEDLPKLCFCFAFLRFALPLGGFLARREHEELTRGADRGMPAPLRPCGTTILRKSTLR